LQCIHTHSLLQVVFKRKQQGPSEREWDTSTYQAVSHGPITIGEMEEIVNFFSLSFGCNYVKLQHKHGGTLYVESSLATKIIFDLKTYQPHCLRKGFSML